MRIHVKMSPKKCDVASRVLFWIVLVFCHRLKCKTQNYTRHDNPNEPISNTDEDERKWSFLKKPVPKIFDEYKAHVCFDDEKTRDKLTHTKSPHEYPEEYNSMCKYETEKELKKYHRYHLGSLRLFLSFELGECIEPEFPCWARRIVPYPSEEKKYCHTHDEYPWMVKWDFHKVKKSHNLKVKNKIFCYYSLFSQKSTKNF